MKKTLALLLLLLSFSALAQDRPITSEERRILGKTMPHLLRTMYVIPEKGEALAKQLQAAFDSGKFDAATTALQLTEALNRELASANDRHLNVRFNPREASRPALTVEAWEQQRAELRAGTAQRPPMRDYEREGMRIANYGVVSAQVLDGNVGYLKVNGFFPADETRAALTKAMAFLENSDAMIVDVRDCPGGNPETVAHLASYFFGPEKRVLMNHYHRPSDRKWESTTVDVPGKRMPDADVYVLTARTGSACEAFAFTLQQWGRAKTVGERSGGGGFNNMLIDVGLGLAFSVSAGTASHPKTGKGWEAVGVQPDIPTDAAKALDVAHAAALRSLESKTTTSETQKRAIRSALLKLDPPKAPEKAAEYIGKYGVREVSLREGALWFQRTGGSGGPLRQTAPDQFSLNGDVTVTFERDDKGAVQSMKIRMPDGRVESAARE
ncbi:MAG TPA: S41 family peptidase [Thermoanaerobaculia bacterium]|nr:S41 family peptidase [Thermoanaerobaculia bacterium]